MYITSPNLLPESYGEVWAKPHKTFPALQDLDEQQEMWSQLICSGRNICPQEGSKNGTN